MDTGERVHRPYLETDRFLDDQVESKSSFERLAVMNDRSRNLPSQSGASRRIFVRETMFVRRFQESGTEVFVSFQPCIDRHASQFGEMRVQTPSFSVISVCSAVHERSAAHHCHAQSRVRATALRQRA